MNGQHCRSIGLTTARPVSAQRSMPSCGPFETATNSRAIGTARSPNRNVPVTSASVTRITNITNEIVDRRAAASLQVVELHCAGARPVRFRQRWLPTRQPKTHRRLVRSSYFPTVFGHTRRPLNSSVAVAWREPELPACLPVRLVKDAGDMQDRNERAARYRATARELRRIAERMITPETRAELLDLAERFERLAAHLSDEEPSLSCSSFVLYRPCPAHSKHRSMTLRRGVAVTASLQRLFGTAEA
jgi:hypothetical protein